MHTPSELSLSKIILGTMGFSEPEHAKEIYAIHAAIERGMTTLDTAPLYGAGESERIVGRAIADRRHQVQLLTKCGLRWDTDHGAVLFHGSREGKPWAPRRDSRPSSIAEEINLSLRRLGTDHIDLMQVHHLDRASPVAETIGALKRAQEAGKIGEIGVSNYPLAQLAQANEALSGRLYGTQNVFNLLQTTQEAEVLRYAREHGLRFLAYSPLRGGVVAGRHLHEPSKRAGKVYGHPKDLERVNGVLERIARPLAAAHGITLAQLALVWTLSQPGVSAAIVGGRSVEDLLESAGALDAQVPPSELQRFGDAMAACGWNPDRPATLGRQVLDLGRRVKRRLGRAARGALRRLPLP